MTETTVEMTEEAKKETVRKYEDDILGGLLAAAAYKTDAEDITPIEVVRGRRYSTHLPDPPDE